MIIYVDIDGTIASITNGEYHKAEPMEANIRKINELYDEGNTIVYWTARGSQTKIDWYKCTANQLTKWNAKHHELKLGKPHYDLYIDDKSINSVEFFNKEQNV